MKKIAIKSFFFSLPIIFFMSLHPALAQQQLFNLDGLAKETDAQKEIFVIMGYILIAAFPLAVSGLIIGGFLYITSAGNEPRAEKAKNVITYSIMGLVIILLAYVIVSTLNTIFIQ